MRKLVLSVYADDPLTLTKIDENAYGKDNMNAMMSNLEEWVSRAIDEDDVIAV